MNQDQRKTDIGFDNRTFIALAGQMVANAMKAANDIVDFNIDFSKVLADGDTIVTSGTAVTVSAGMTGGSATHTNTQVGVKLTGGTAATSYTVTFVATTTLGFVHKFVLTVLAINSPVIGIYTKRVAEILKFNFDYTQWLNSGDTLSTKSITVQAGLTAGAATISSPNITQILSGGTDANTYTVTVSTTTTNGYTVERIINVIVSGA